MQAYIAILGRSVWALINTYYAVLKENRFHPDHVYIVAEECYRDGAKKAESDIKILSEHYGLSS